MTDYACTTCLTVWPVKMRAAPVAAGHPDEAGAVTFQPAGIVLKRFYRLGNDRNDIALDTNIPGGE
jgi:hypothetical protein